MAFFWRNIEWTGLAEEVIVFDRFSDRARKVMSFARQEAERFNHEYIGPEHILLGLVKEGTGVAVHVLENLRVDLEKIRVEVEKLIKPGPDEIIASQLPFSARGKMVLAFAIDEARALDHNYVGHVGTEHVLLGLLREDQSPAAQILKSMELKLEGVRTEVMEFLGTNPTGEKVVKPSRTHAGAGKTIHNIAGDIMEFALKEAKAQGVDVITSDLILLGLLSVPDSLAAKVLKKYGLELDTVRTEIMKMRAESSDSN